MEVCFDLLIQNADFDSLPFKEELVYWGGESFSQEPKYFVWNKSLKFKQVAIPAHFYRYIPADFAIGDCYCLSLASDAIAEWEKWLNGAENKGDVPALKVMLKQLLTRLEKWVVVFELNCDQIDGVYNINEDELLTKIENTLDWHKTPEGFVGWNKIHFRNED